MDLKHLTAVLVPLDPAELSVEALRAASDLVSDHRRVHVVAVLPELHPMDPAVTPELTDDVRRTRTVAHLADKLATLGFDDAKPFARIGEPAHQIAQLAEELGADLIVMASHGYTGVRHLLLGSVAERVVRRAGCPVLVLKRDAS